MMLTAFLVSLLSFTATAADPDCTSSDAPWPWYAADCDGGRYTDVCRIVPSTNYLDCEAGADHAASPVDVYVYAVSDYGSNSDRFSFWGTTGENELFCCTFADDDYEYIEINTYEATDDTDDQVRLEYGSDKLSSLNGGALSVWVSMGPGDDQGWGTSGTSMHETWTLGSGADTVTMRSGGTVFGGDGQDTIYGSTEDDDLWGEGGIDTIEGDEGQDCIFGEGGGDTLKGNEDGDLIVGGAGADNIWGKLGADEIWGSGGDDIISGGGGADEINGGGGDDDMDGDGGTDTICGGANSSDELNGGTEADILWVDYPSSPTGSEVSGDTNHCGDKDISGLWAGAYCTYDLDDADEPAFCDASTTSEPTSCLFFP